jgi:hypothetical protein
MPSFLQEFILSAAKNLLFLADGKDLVNACETELCL